VDRDGGRYGRSHSCARRRSPAAFYALNRYPIQFGYAESPAVLPIDTVRALEEAIQAARRELRAVAPATGRNLPS